MNKNVPNVLCLVRIVCAPFVVAFLAGGWRITGLVLFCLAMLTDLFDGKIARKYHLISDFGKFLDPLADKMLVLGAMIALVGLDIYPALPVALILAREFAVSGLRMVAASKGEVIAAQMAGKVKTMSQSICLVITLALNVWPGIMPLGHVLAGTDFIGDGYALTRTAGIVSLVLIWAIAAVTLISAVPYFKQGIKYLKG